MIGLTSGGDYFAVKGVDRRPAGGAQSGGRLVVRPTRKTARSRALGRAVGPHAGESHDLLLGYLGEVSRGGLKRFELRGGTTVAELKLSTLAQIANLIPNTASRRCFRPCRAT